MKIIDVRLTLRTTPVYYHPSKLFRDAPMNYSPSKDTPLHKVSMKTRQTQQSQECNQMELPDHDKIPSSQDRQTPFLGVWQSLQ